MFIYIIIISWNPILGYTPKARIIRINVEKRPYDIGSRVIITLLTFSCILRIYTYIFSFYHEKKKTLIVLPIPTFTFYRTLYINNQNTVLKIAIYGNYSRYASEHEIMHIIINIITLDVHYIYPIIQWTDHYYL